MLRASFEELSENKRKRYDYLKNIRYGVFEGKDDYYMICINKVAHATSFVLDRYIYYEKNQILERNKNKIMGLIQLEYDSNRGVKWIELIDYIWNE